MNIIKKFLPGSAPNKQQSGSPGKPHLKSDKSLATMQSEVLKEVLSTIELLNESQGSRPSTILSYILMSDKLGLPQPIQHVKQAIRTGLKAGLIRNVGGKIKLGLIPKDYKTFKKFVRKGDGLYWRKKFGERRVKHKNKGHKWKKSRTRTSPEKENDDADKSERF